MAETDRVPAVDGIYNGISDETYHGDRASLSSSGARLLLDTTPARFRWQQENGQAPKKAFDLGHAVHTQTLGTGPGVFVPVDKAGKPYDEWRTDHAKEQVADARAEGLVPLKPTEAKAAADMTEALRSHKIAGRLFASGAAEQSLWWIDEATGVRCRARFDWLTDVAGQRIGVDLKTTENAAERVWRKSAADFGYHVQQPWYQAGHEAIGLGPIDFVFVLVEKNPPYLVTVYRLSDEDLAAGWARGRRALELYARCTETGEWPGYPDDEIRTITLPPWAAA